MDNNAVKTRKILIVVGAVIGVALLSLVLLFLGKLNNAEVKIRVTPLVAKVKIGEKEYGADETVSIAAGEYNAEISAEGFETKTVKFTALAGKTSELSAFLEPTDPDSTYYNDNQADSMIKGEIKAKEIYETMQRLREEHPILKRLPIKVDRFNSDYSVRIKYTVSYTVDENNEVIILVKDYTKYGLEAIKKEVEKKGSTFDNCKVDYQDLSIELQNGKAF